MKSLAHATLLLRTFIGSGSAFYIALVLFVLGATYIAAGSLYPMAFDEEFHYGLLQIYAAGWLPYGIEHSGDMAQYGAATADASYLFHYLMSFPYRLFAAIGVPENGIIIALRLINIALAAAALVVFRRALLEAGMSRRVTNVALICFMLIPVLSMLAAQINYDNLLLLIIAWCILLIVKITNAVRAGDFVPVQHMVTLFAAVLLGMSVKYAFLPLALGMFLWIIGLVYLNMRARRQSFLEYGKSLFEQWTRVSQKAKYILIGLVFISVFFVSHYITSTLTYGSPIPSCDRVFTDKECEAYGPWNRNRNYAANKDAAFTPMTYPEYMAAEWFPDMAQRLTFAVAGKTNNFQTQLPLPPLVYGLATLSIIGLGCIIVQAFRRRLPWFASFTALLSLIYAGVLSYQLYSDYIATAQPVAINGRYLLPLLPLVAAGMIDAMRRSVPTVNSSILATLTTVVVLYLIICGAGAGTYIVLSESHWYWPGFGQSSHDFLQPVFEWFIPTSLRFDP